MNQTNITISNQRLKRAILRRVWYAYSLSVVLSRAALSGFLFGASMIAFWKLVSVSSIISNVLAVRVGELPWFVAHALIQAQTLALIAFGIIVFTLLSVGLKFTLPATARFHHLSSV